MITERMMMRLLHQAFLDESIEFFDPDMSPK